LTRTVELEVPPLLVATQENVLTPSVESVAGGHSPDVTSELESVTLQRIWTVLVNQPPLPSGREGLSCALTSGPSLSSDWKAESASRKPAPQSGSGIRELEVQSMAFSGRVKTRSISPAPAPGRLERRTAAIPAALGTAALVPKKLSKPGTVVLTPSAAASSGFSLTCGAGSRTPAASKSVVAGPREL
jgi:hypothetical protein